MFVWCHCNIKTIPVHIWQHPLNPTFRFIAFQPFWTLSLWARDHSSHFTDVDLSVQETSESDRDDMGSKWPRYHSVFHVD